MDFAPTEEQLELQRQAVAFARDRLDRVWCVRDEEEFPRAAWQECAVFGLLGLVAPSEYGGADHDCLTAAIILEGLGYGCADHGLAHALLTQILCTVQLRLFGTTEQQRAYLPDLISGRRIAAQAMTEPNAGSDVSAVSTRALEQDGGYRLTGRKVFATNGPIADIALVFAVTDPERPGLARLSCFIVDRDRSPFERSRPLSKLGLHTMKNGGLFFDDCRVGADALLGTRGAGASMFAEVMEWERILLFATQIGKMQRVLETTVRYANTRVQSGQRIGRFQAVSNKVAIARVNLELGRLIAYKAAWLKSEGKPAALDAAIAKYFISESCKAACLDAVQIHGGYGFSEEYEVAHHLRDSIGGTIYSGTSEILLNVIARLSGIR
jgi:alkylation response protein AidB-like acyl-CoA dehydrogenase